MITAPASTQKEKTFLLLIILQAIWVITIPFTCIVFFIAGMSGGGNFMLLCVAHVILSLLSFCAWLLYSQRYYKAAGLLVLLPALTALPGICVILYHS